MKNKSFLFFIVLAALLLSSYNFVSAALPPERPLEINYPQLNGSHPTTVSTPIPQYVVYIFNFLVWATGIFAFFVLIYAGFKYLTSAGNVERIIDAKSQIWAAFLGMIILFGSYLILININPQLIAFNLPTLKPIISSLTGGVWLCKQQPQAESGGDAFETAWSLFLEYNMNNPTKERQKQIQQEINSSLNKINSTCYLVPGQGDIRSDFDNKSKFIYFVPDLKFDKDGNPISATEYGAVLYKDQKFGGISNPLIDHLTSSGECKVYSKQLVQSSDASSIKPFRLIYNPDKNWEAILYQKPNMNKGFPDLEPQHLKIDSYGPNCMMWWCQFSFGIPPRSIKITGDLLAILITSDYRSDTFFSDDNDLEDNLNIVNWVDCADYEGADYMGECAVAATDKAYLLSGSIY